LALLGTGVTAAVIADTFWYMTGHRYGLRVLRMLCRISLSPDSCVSQTESIFVRFGARSMLIAKFVPGFASVSTAMAGAVGLRYACGLSRIGVEAAPAMHSAIADGPRDGGRAAPVHGAGTGRVDPRRAFQAGAGGERPHPRRARHRHGADRRGTRRRGEG